MREVLCREKLTMISSQQRMVMNMAFKEEVHACNVMRNHFDDYNRDCHGLLYDA